MYGCTAKRKLVVGREPSWEIHPGVPVRFLAERPSPSPR